jgi:hypothetical protein
MISSSQRPLPDNTQHTQQTNIHAPGGIRTHDRSRRAAVDLCLRPRGHWDRLIVILQTANSANIQDIDALLCVKARSCAASLWGFFWSCLNFSKLFHCNFCLWKPGQSTVPMSIQHLKAWPEFTVPVKETKCVNSKRDPVVCKKLLLFWVNEVFYRTFLKSCCCVVANMLS